MERRIAFIGFGEAGRAFAAQGMRQRAHLRAYDRKTDCPHAAAEMRAAYQNCGVDGRGTPAEALDGTEAVLSLVTADQALDAARACARFLPRGALWLDMNSVAPDTKRAARDAIEQAGGRYVDVAVMAPVHPARQGAPLLLSGPHAEAAVAVLADAAFGNVRRVEGEVGAASAIKMIRSVMVKGIEALSAECALAAHQAGVAAEVIASLDASWPGADWARRFDYNLDRMLVHGLRRAAEMEEVVKTLDALGTGSEMTRGTVVRQRALGALGVASPEGLQAKIDAILDRKSRAA